MKLLTVFTGGTIGCSENGGTLAPDAANSALLLRLYRDRTGDRQTEFTAVQPFRILSENMDFARLQALYDCLAAHEPRRYDGVIIAHGTDTLPYTAAYLSLRLGQCAPPVVLVSANYPLADSRSNGVDNFCGAVRFLQARQGGGVFVAYRNTGDGFTTIHRGSELLPHAPYSDSVFSLFGNCFGRVGENGEFVKNLHYIERSLPSLSVRDSGEDVLWLRAHVGMHYPQDLSPYRAALLEGYHSGTLCTEGEPLRDFCRRAAACGLPVYLTGADDGFHYESKQAYTPLGIRVLPPMSPVTAYMILRSHTILK